MGKKLFLFFISIPFFLFLGTKEEPAWHMLSFEINVFLALIMAGLGYIGENLNKKEKKFLFKLSVKLVPLSVYPIRNLHI